MADITKEQIIFELQAEVSAAEAKVDRFRAAIDKAKASGAQVGANLKNGLAGAQKQLANTTKQLKQYEVASKKAAGGSNFLYTQVGYLASDARYGLLGMGNNLSIVAVQLQNMRSKAKEAGETFSGALWKGFKAGGWFMIALQVIIVALPEIIKYFKSWGEETDEVVKSVSELNPGIKELTKLIEEENEILEEQLELLEKQIVAEIKLLKHSRGKEDDIAARLISLGLITNAEEFLNLAYQDQVKFLRELKDEHTDLEKAAEKRAQAISGEETDDKILRLLGLTTKTQDLVNKADIAIKKLAARTGKSYAEAATIYWDSPAGRLSAATIRKAKNDAELLEIKQSAKAQEEAFNIEYADMLNRAKARVKAYKKAKEGGFLYTDAELEKMFADDTDANTLNAAGDAVDYAEDLAFDPEEDPEFQALVLKGQALRSEKAYWTEIFKSDAQLAADQEIADLKLKLDREIITEEQFEAAKKRIKQRAVTSEIKMRGQQLQQAGALLKKGGKIQIAGVLVEQGAALFDVVKGVQGRIKAIKNLPDPTGISQGLLIAKAVGEGVLEGGIIAGTAAKSIQQIKQASGASGGAGGGASRPSFNIIGQNSNNALQATIQEQTGVLQGATTDQRVVLVQSDLEVKQGDHMVAVETATL